MNFSFLLLILCVPGSAFGRHDTSGGPSPQHRCYRQSIQNCEPTAQSISICVGDFTAGIETTWGLFTIKMITAPNLIKKRICYGFYADGWGDWTKVLRGSTHHFLESTDKPISSQIIPTVPAPNAPPHSQFTNPAKFQHTFTRKSYFHTHKHRLKFAALHYQALATP